jgi:hypothetical protein
MYDCSDLHGRKVIVFYTKKNKKSFKKGHKVRGLVRTFGCTNTMHE